VVLAAAAAGIEKTMHYRWLRHAGYARDFAHAEIEFHDCLKACAIARAKDGVLEPVFYSGAPCGAIRKYSDGIMMYLLKRGEEKQAARVEVSGPGGGPVQVSLARLTEAELESLAAITAILESDGERDRGGETAPETAQDR
jgi:hypothetical protein